MEHHALLSESPAALAQRMTQALEENRTDEAEIILNEIAEFMNLPPDDEDTQAFRIMLTIQRGRPMDALVALNNLGDQRLPELRALCLQRIGDPLWEGVANSVLQDTSNEQVRLAMRQLLGQDVD